MQRRNQCQPLFPGLLFLYFFHHSVWFTLSSLLPVICTGWHRTLPRLYPRRATGSSTALCDKRPHRLPWLLPVAVMLSIRVIEVHIHDVCIKSISAFQSTLDRARCAVFRAHSILLPEDLLVTLDSSTQFNKVKLPRVIINDDVFVLEELRSQPQLLSTPYKAGKRA